MSITSNENGTHGFHGREAADLLYNTDYAIFNPSQQARHRALVIFLFLIPGFKARPSGIARKQEGLIWEGRLAR